MVEIGEQISLTAQVQKCDLLTAACLFSCAGQIVKEMLSTKSLRTRFITFIQDHGFMDTACCNSYDCLFQFQKKTIVSIYCPTSPSDKSSLWVQCIRWSPTYSCQRLNSTKTQCASLLSFDWRPTTATKITNWRFCGKAFWKPASNTSNASNAFKCFQYFHWWNSSKL